MTAALVGLKNRAAVFAVQRWVSTYADEPLMAILPGVALDELWSVVGVGENALLLMSALVALVSLAGLVSVVMAGLNERRRELAVLRAVGAEPAPRAGAAGARRRAGHAAGRGDRHRLSRCWASPCFRPGCNRSSDWRCTCPNLH